VLRAPRRQHECVARADASSIGRAAAGQPSREFSLAQDGERCVRVAGRFVLCTNIRSYIEQQGSIIGAWRKRCQARSARHQGIRERRQPRRASVWQLMRPRRRRAAGPQREVRRAL